MPKTAEASYIPGLIAGHVDLASAIVVAAADQARVYFEEQEALDFCGDEVGSMDLPNWLIKTSAWLPEDSLTAWGLAPVMSKADFIATVGVDMHSDGINGLTLCVVLHNDGMKFQQRGRPRWVPVPGDWFIFDDSIDHAVHSTAKSTTFLCITVPVQRLAS